MAGVTTFPVVPRPGALRCHEAEHSPPAALARGWSGLRRLGTNATIAASAPWRDSGQGMGCPSPQTLSWEGLQDLIPSAVASAGHFGSSEGERWTGVVPNEQRLQRSGNCVAANSSRLYGHLGVLLSSTENIFVCVLLQQDLWWVGGPFTGAWGMWTEAAGRRKYFWISGFSLFWGRDADGGKARLKRALDLLRSLLLTQHETQPSLLSWAEGKAAGSWVPPMATARALSVSGGCLAPLECLGNFCLKTHPGSRATKCRDERDQLEGPVVVGEAATLFTRCHFKKVFFSLCLICKYLMGCIRA